MNGSPTGEWVSEVKFTKVVGHRLNPIYDNIIFRAYASLSDIRNGLQNGTLDIAYGMST